MSKLQKKSVWMTIALALILSLVLSVGVSAAGSDIATLTITSDGETVPTLETVSPETHEYRAVLDHDMTEATVLVSAVSSEAVILINDEPMPDTGAVIAVPVSTSDTPYVNVSVKITYTEGYSESTQRYSVQLYRKPDASLTHLSLRTGGVEKLPDYDPSVFSYSVKLGHSVSALVMNYEAAAGAEAEVSVTEGSFETIPVGTSTVKVCSTVGKNTVYETSAEYTVQITREMDTSLSGITVTGSDETDYSPSGFSKDTLTYNIDVPNAVTSLTVNGILNDPSLEGTARIEVSSTDLEIGTNIITVRVSTPDDALTEYKLNVKRAGLGSHVSTLDSLSVYLADGGSISISPAFSKDVLEYTAEVENEIDAINIQVTLTEPETETYLISGNTDLQVGENTISVFVYAQDTTYSKYVIRITRKTVEIKSNDATLSSMSVEGIMLVPVFSSGNQLYAITVPAEMTSLPLTAVANDPHAKVEINNPEKLPVGTTDVTVKVTAEDGTTTRTYTISVTRPKADGEKDSDPNLKSLRLVDEDTGTDIVLSPAFDTEVTEYTASCENVEKIRVKASNRSKTGFWILGRTSGAVMEVEEGENKITITAKAEDGTKKVYTILLTVTKENVPMDPSVSETNALLAALTADNGITLEPAFSSAITEYRMEVPNSCTHIVLTGTPVSSKASVTNREVDLQEGDNVIAIVVTSGDGSASVTYTVTVYRTPAAKVLSGSVSIVGDLKPGSVVTAEFSSEETGATVSYEWFVGGVSAGNGSTYEIREEDAGKMIYVVVSGTGIYNGSLSSSIVKIEAPDVTTPAETTGPDRPIQEPDAKLPPVVVILIVVGCVGLIIGLGFFIFGRRR